MNLGNNLPCKVTKKACDAFLHYGRDSSHPAFPRLKYLKLDPSSFPMCLATRFISPNLNSINLKEPERGGVCEWDPHWSEPTEREVKTFLEAVVKAAPPRMVGIGVQGAIYDPDLLRRLVRAMPTMKWLSLRLIPTFFDDLAPALERSTRCTA